MKNRIFICLCIFFLANLVFLSVYHISSTLAKYKGSEPKDGYLQGVKSFYFTSDLLLHDTYLEDNTYEAYGTFDINLFNCDSNNHNLITNTDIGYRYGVDYYDSGNVLLNDISFSNTGTLMASVDNISTYSFSVPFRREAKYVKVEVTTNSLYQIKLVGLFEYPSSTTNYYSFDDFGNFCRLRIITGNVVPNNITVNYGADFAPDNTNDYMVGFTNGNSGIITNLSPNITYDFYFFETTLKEHDSINNTSFNTIITLPID